MEEERKPFVMTNEYFQTVYQEFIRHEGDLMGIKKVEYATNQDRLLNFRERADMVGITAEEILLCDLSKHIHAIYHAIKTGGYVWAWRTAENNEGFKQRIADAVNYLHLLAGLLEEEHRRKEG